MTQEEMIEQLISLKENAKVNIDIDEIFKKDYEALETVLNLVKKQNKIIDLMPEMLVKVPNNSDNPQTASIVAMMNRDLELKKIKVKQYFEMKVENDN